MPNADPIVQLSCRAMNTTFEVALWGRDEPYLLAAAEEALREIRSLDQQLSYYRDDSDVRELNVYAASAPVQVEPRLFALLQHARALGEATGGAFDITVGPLLRAWGMTGGGGQVPSEEEVQAARALTGWDLLELDPERSTVHFAREGVQIELGAIGKGYAIDRAVELLRDSEIPGGLIHGGTSTVAAIGPQPDGSPWQIAIQDPADPEGLLDTVLLTTEALSVSAVHGKYFTEGEERYGHVLDPRLGRPVQAGLLAAVICASAADSDALSTALLVAGAPLFETIGQLHPEARAVLVLRSDAGPVQSLRFPS
jgi:thiamine biosynthesis lipoprotein